MITEETMKRLRWHAGLAERPSGAGGTPVAGCIGASDASSSELEPAMSDLFEALGLLNVELNGRLPSESRTATDAVPRSIAYAVAEISRMLRDAAGRGRDDRSELAGHAWRVDTAWLAVLAGDVDDLLSHVNDEAAMRE